MYPSGVRKSFDEGILWSLFPSTEQPYNRNCQSDKPGSFLYLGFLFLTPWANTAYGSHVLFLPCQYFLYHMLWGRWRLLNLHPITWFFYLEGVFCHPSGETSFSSLLHEGIAALPNVSPALPALPATHTEQSHLDMTSASREGLEPLSSHSTSLQGHEPPSRAFQPSFPPPMTGMDASLQLCVLVCLRVCVLGMEPVFVLCTLTAAGMLPFIHRS